MNAEKSNVGLYTGIFVGGLVVGVLIGWGIVGSRQSSTATTMTDNATAATATSATSSTTVGAMNLSGSTMGLSGLTIPSPQNAGTSVTISEVSVSEPTWVVVYEDTKGVPGNALGAELFFPASQGGATSGSVPLLRATTSGQTYLVGESVDNGDHTFSLDTDKQVRDNKGNLSLVEFKTN